MNALFLNLGQCPAAQYGNHMPGMGWGGWGFPWGWLVLVIIIVVAAVLLAPALRQGRNAPGGESALDILKKRYARGEISKEEYERMKEELR